MRSIIKCLLAVGAGFAMVATSASAAETQDEMREMRELVLQLQDRLEAQQEQIDTQQEVIQEAGLEDERGSDSALSSFLESTEFSGWVAASYFWNFNNPRNPQNGGNATLSNPFHQDHNSFQFDEAWFVMSRSPTEESPAGFEFEVTYGATGTALAETVNGSRGTVASGGSSGNQNGNEVWVVKANVQYMTPWGQTITAGKFGTLIGYEVAGAPSNVNITRGFAYNNFQPFSQTGVLVGQSFDNGFTYTVGAVNGLANEQFDTNMSKGFMWQVGWGNDTVTALFNGMYDSDVEGPGDDLVIYDVVVELTPADNLLFWLNYDYFETQNVPGGGGTEADPYNHAVAVGGRVGITDDIGLGGRFEYAYVDSDTGTETNWYSWTTTGDWSLTDNLTWKVEYKYEAAGKDAKNIFPDGRQNRPSGGSFDSDVHYLGTQLYYEF